MKNIARLLVIALSASILGTITGIAPSQAVPGTLTETFTGATLSNPNNWLATSAGNSGVHPCLTAAASGTTISLSGSTLAGCAGAIEAAGSGALLLTTNGNYQAATMLYKAAIPTAAGLDLSFYEAQYGGNGADGISFFTQDGAIADVSVGADGGALGYGGFKKNGSIEKPGIRGGLFAVGFDAYGNATASQPSGSEVRGGLLCNGESQPFTPKALVVRGPDTSATQDGTAGYCYLGGTTLGASYFGTSSSTRTSAGIPVRIIVDPATDADPKIHIYIWQSGALNQALNTASVKLDIAEPAQYKAAKTVKFGFSASTGGANNNHAIWGMNIAPADPVKSPTLYVVPDATTVDATDPAIYTYKIYSDESRTVAVNPASLSNFVAPVCTSPYTTSSAIGTTFTITCSGASAGLYQVDHTATAILTVIQGTPTLTPASRTITGTSGSAISGAALVAKKFRNAVTFSINPPLPAGLTFNTTNGAISGTPTSAIIGAFIVTATDGISSLTSTVSMTISAGTNIQSDTKTVTDTKTVIVVETKTVVITETITPPGPDVNNDSVVSLLPVSGYANDELTITGSFSHAITSIKVDGLLLPANSWKQDKTTIKFNAPGHNVGKVDVQISNGLLPEFPVLHFEYLELNKLGDSIKIKGIKCLGTFDKPCKLKPGSAQPVSFALNSNALSAKSIKVLKSWKLETAKSVVVYGYASTSGTKALNDALTKRRAAEVGAWVKKNWPNLTVQTKGQGTTVNRLCKRFDNKCAMITIVSLAKK